MDITSLVKIKTLKIEKETIILNNDAIGKWCQRSYSGHKKGCPNYGKNPLCPPNSFYFGDIINKYNYFYLIYAEFNFKEYIEKRREEHPEWSEKQLKNSRYWQNSVKSILKKRVLIIYEINPKKEIYLLGCGSGFNDKKVGQYQEKISSMESVGINVFSTMKLNGIKLEINPINKIRLICLFSSIEKLNGLNLQKKCKLCNEYFSSSPLSLDLFCGRSECFEVCVSKRYYLSLTYKNISEIEDHHITKIKKTRSITADTFDLYDLDRPIIREGKTIGYERVCRGCGSPLRKKDGKYSYHMRYCKEHRGMGYKLFDKYNWGPCAKEYLRKIQERFSEVITTQIKELEILKEHQHLVVICEECKKLCKITNYYDPSYTFLHLDESKRRIVKLELINVHHIIPVHTLTKENILLIWEESNLICLCQECHWSKHRSEAKTNYKVDPLKYKTIDQFM